MGENQKKKIDFGFTLQKRICEKYGLEIDEKSNKLFDEFYEKELLNQIDKLISKIFKLVHWKPQKFLPLLSQSESMCVANYILTHNKSLSIRKSSSGKVPPRVVGQPGINKINFYFGNILGKRIDSQNIADLRKMFTDKNVLKEAIPIFLKFLLMCDYNVFVDQKDNVILLRKMQGEINIDVDKLGISKSEKYPTITYNGLSIAIIGFGRNTFNFRFNIKNIQEFIEKVKVNKSTERGIVGKYVEKAICENYGIENDIYVDVKQHKEFFSELQGSISEAFSVDNIIPDTYVGNVVGEDAIKEMIYEKTGNEKHLLIEHINRFGSRARSAIDFFSNTYAISVKSTRNASSLVCPDTVGQPNKDSCKVFLAKVWSEWDSDITPEGFVNVVMNPTKIVDVLIGYMEYLFECDYLLWVENRGGSVKARVLSKTIEGELALNYKWNVDKITYNKSKEKFLEKVLDSKIKHGTNQIDYNGIRLGQFDIHSRNGRYVYQYRFNLRNVLDIIYSEGEI